MLGAAVGSLLNVCPGAEHDDGSAWWAWEGRKGYAA